VREICRLAPEALDFGASGIACLTNVGHPFDEGAEQRRLIRLESAVTHRGAIRGEIVEGDSSERMLCEVALPNLVPKRCVARRQIGVDWYDGGVWRSHQIILRGRTQEKASTERALDGGELASRGAHSVDESRGDIQRIRR
jgi:hypothetical protein